jgi:hypothetical protein
VRPWWADLVIGFFIAGLLISHDRWYRALTRVAAEVNVNGRQELHSNGVAHPPP